MTQLPDHNRRLQQQLTLLSWLSPFVALALVVLLFTASIGQTQDQSTRKRARDLQSSDLVCTMHSFFAFDANDRVRDFVHIEGRGLANCQNEQGIKLEIPVHATLEAAVVSSLIRSGELSFTADSSVFVIPQDMSRLQDRYDVQSTSIVTSAANRFTPVVLLRGVQNDMVIQMELASATAAFDKIDVKSLTLSIDETAPNLD